MTDDLPPDLRRLVKRLVTAAFRKGKAAGRAELLPALNALATTAPPPLPPAREGTDDDRDDDRDADDLDGWLAGG